MACQNTENVFSGGNERPGAFSGAIYWLRLENAQNEPFESFLKSFGCPRPKMLKMSLREAFWGNVLAQVRKWLK